MPAPSPAVLAAGESSSPRRRPWPCAGPGSVITGLVGGFPAFIHLTKTCRLPSKLRKNPKNTKSVSLECLDLNLQGKNVNSCEMNFLLLLNLGCVLGLFN